MASRGTHDDAATCYASSLSLANSTAVTLRAALFGLASDAPGRRVMAGTAAPIKKKVQVNVQDSRVSPPTCGGQYKREKNPRERSRSTLPPSPEGSRSAASATAAAASARALASSALSSRTSTIALCSAGIVCDACDCDGVFRLPVDLPSDLRVLLL